MQALWKDIDGLLRGRFTRREDLEAGQLPVPARTLVLGGLILGAAYGLFMGIYGATRPLNATAAQLFASTLKVPLLFLLTLVVTLPSLYVLSALAGSRLLPKETLRLLLAAVIVNLAMLASLGPVVGFFTLSTESYPFMVVLNVLFFGAAGVAGLVFLRSALGHVFAGHERTLPQTSRRVVVPEPEPEEPGGEPKDLQMPSHRVITVREPTREPGRRVFRAWLVVYGVVGAQMGWILRPFIGSPDLPFEWFRERESHFLEAFLRSLSQLFS